MEAQLKNDIKLSWGTPVLMVRVPESDDVCAALQSAIVTRRSEADISAVCWHSSPDLLEWPIPAARQFQNWVVDAFQRIQARASEGPVYEGRLNVRCWGSVLTSGHATGAQRLTQSAWTGVCRVDDGGEGADEGVGLILRDPRPGAGLCQDPFGLFGQDRRFPLAKGQIVLFPSWLTHTIDAGAAQDGCVSVSFALALLDLM